MDKFTGYLLFGLGIAFGSGVTTQRLMTEDYDLLTAIMAGTYIILGSFILGRKKDKADATS